MKNLCFFGVMTVVFSLALGLGIIGAMASSAAWAQSVIKIGSISGPDMEILEKAKIVASREGLTIEIKDLRGYSEVNDALVNKEIDLNAYQHQPYLDEYNKANGTQLVSIGSTYVSPLGFFSRKIKKLAELKDGDTVVIPKDPTNGGRALLLLQKAGIIKLKPAVGLTPTPADVIENPKNLIILEIEPAKTPSALDDVAAVAINNTYSIPAGLNPVKNSIYLESVDSPYVNVIVARPEDSSNPLFLKFVKAYQSQEVADYIYENFEYSIIPSFPHQKKDN
jgi:D-methionine transport system substrate-binding protein